LRLGGLNWIEPPRRKGRQDKIKLSILFHSNLLNKIFYWRAWRLGDLSFPMKLRSLLALLLILSGCMAAEMPVVPTAQPTATPTPTGTPTRIASAQTPLPTATRAALTPTGGPSPTPLIGQANVSAVIAPTGTRSSNPNAPRIEFFTTNVLNVNPGDSVTLFWSARGADTAAIYRLDAGGNRTQLWNVGPDGQLSVDTRRSDRGQLQFVLTIGDGANQVEQVLTIPLACPDTWFFNPPPTACPLGAALETSIIEEPFERGRMIYIASSNRVYALFNDTFEPAWISVENRFDPAIHPESEPSFQPPPGLYQPLRILGFVWRGNDTVRSRLGLAIQPEFSYQGFVQAAPAINGAESVYVSSADGTVLELVPGGEGWQIITPG
jgi:hypothetical protein